MNDRSSPTTRYTVVMPSVETGMERGRVIEYLAELGTEVTRGQPLFVAEGDKVSMEIEAAVTGTVAEFCVALGEEVACGSPVLVLEIAEPAGD